MLDGDMPTRSVYDRLTALRAWRNGWHKAKWTTRSVHDSIRDFAGWNSGDTFTEATDTTRSLSFFRVPSLSRRVKEGNWKLEGLNETGIINWHHDDVQDLLIVHDRYVIIAYLIDDLPTITPDQMRALYNYTY